MTTQHGEGPYDRAELTIRLPLVTDLERRQVFERVVARGHVIVERPDSDLLKKYHELLIEALGEDQVEPLERLQKELASNDNSDATARFICILLRDPGAGDRIASGVYGSVQDGVLATRFLVTVQDEDEDKSYRGTGISQEIYRLLVAEANRWSVSQRGQTVWGYVGECVHESETFFNRLLGRRRLYVPEPDGTALREIYYELPPLGSWTRDARPLDRKGKPLDPNSEPVREHLQIAAAGYAGKLPFAVLERMLKAFWHAWYIRPKDDFDGSFWEQHYNRVIDETLLGRILEPIRPHGELVLLSRKEREERRQQGQVIHDLKTK